MYTAREPLFREPLSSGISGVEAGVCAEKRRLMGAFLDAIHSLATVQNAQMDAVLKGDSNFCDFEDLIYEAREKKDLAKYAYLSHVQEHGCHDGARTYVPHAS